VQHALLALEVDGHERLARRRVLDRRDGERLEAGRLDRRRQQ
jgi:hypothetical protein